MDLYSAGQVCGVITIILVTVALIGPVLRMFESYEHRERRKQQLMADRARTMAWIAQEKELYTGIQRGWRR